MQRERLAAAAGGAQVKSGPITLEDVGDEEVAEALNAIMQEMDRMNGRVDRLEKQLRRERGGSQPDSKLSVTKDNGTPSRLAAEVMSQVKQSSKRNPFDRNNLDDIFEEHGIDRTRKMKLNFMRKIASEFDKYHYRAGKGSRSSQLYYSLEGGSK